MQISCSTPYTQNLHYVCVYVRHNSSINDTDVDEQLKLNEIACIVTIMRTLQLLLSLEGANIREYNK